MPYAQIDVDAPDHWKVGGLSDAAFRTWVLGQCYAQKHLTDGFLDRRAVKLFRSRTSPAVIAELVSAMLWHESDAGFTIHDYADWNNTAEEVEERREKWRRDKKRKRKSSTGMSTVDSAVESVETPPIDTIRDDTQRNDTERETPPSGPVTGYVKGPARVVGVKPNGVPVLRRDGPLVAAWCEAAATRGVNLTGVTDLDRERLASIKASQSDVIAAIRAWWASPFIIKHPVSFFVTDAPEAIAHVTAGHAYAFRDPKPPKPVPVRSSWCDHTPECHTQAEHKRLWLNEERIKAGLAPHHAPVKVSA